MSCRLQWKILPLALVLTGIRVANAQTNRMLLGGRIVTPSGVLPHGWIEIQNGKILHLYPKRPSLGPIPTLETDDYIFPGFIDLHNHPFYNVFPRWTPPETYPNRYAWRDSAEYKRLIEQPAAKLLTPENFCDLDEYVEIKALLGGTTSMIGISAGKPATGSTPATPTPACVKGLLRNLDSYTGFYGPDPDHERIVNSIGILPRDMDANRAAAIARDLRDGTLDLLAIHLAEGLPTDPESASELDALEARNLLTAHTVLVHSVGLSASQLLRVHNANAAIVWSPHSNFVLYGATADVVSAVHNGVSIALAPDWAPTGSDNMLDEIKYAANVSQTKLNGLFSNRQLVEMAGAIPARIARIDDKIGTIAPGQYADLFLFKPTAAATNPADVNPYDALVHGGVSGIDLVMVQGVPLYGTPALFAPLGIAVEPVAFCGETRALNADALPAGSFAAVSGRLSEKMKALGIDLAPLAECIP